MEAAADSTAMEVCLDALSTVLLAAVGSNQQKYHSRKIIVQVTKSNCTKGCGSCSSSHRATCISRAEIQQ